MENYNEKVNYGNEEHPLWRERLVVSKVQYGYSLYDRKNKKNLINQQKKFDCEFCKKLLLDGNFNDFETYKENIKVDIVSENKIIIFKHKHYNNYYNINTFEQLKKVSLVELQSRIDMNYIQKWDLPDELDFKEEDIQNMPESLKKDATSKLKLYKRNLREIVNNNMVFEQAHKAINENDGELAWNVLQLRNGHEYENYEIIEPTNL